MTGIKEKSGGKKFDLETSSMIETRGLESHKRVDQAKKSDEEAYRYFSKVDED